MIVDAASAGFKLDPTEGRELRVMGERIKAAAIEQLAPRCTPCIPNIRHHRPVIHQPPRTR